MLNKHGKTKAADYDWTLFDSIDLSLWYIALFGLIYYFGFIIGILVYAVLAEVIAFGLYHGFGLEIMTGGDCIFFQDD